MKHLLSLVLLMPLFGYSQSGPGGVGSTDGSSILELWFDGQDVNGDGTNPSAGATVASWADKSGNGVTVSENTANIATYSNPGVTFNNTGYLLGNDASLPGGNASRTVFVVASSPNTANDDVFFFYGDGADNNSFGILKLGNEGVRFFFYNNDLDDGGGWLPFNQTKIVAGKYTSGTPGFRQIFVNGTQTTSGNPPATPNTITDALGLQIGGWSRWPLFSEATIHEVLFYSSAINEAQRYIIENYLAAKYGTTLATHDIYNEDNAGNGNYDYEVAGIGRVNGANIHNDAQGTGIVRMLNATGLGNNEFLIWGHDNGIPQAVNATDIPAGVEARFDRIWRVSEANSTGTAIDVGAIDIRFDLTGFGTITASDLRLLVDTDNDGVFSDETPIGSAADLGGNVYQFASMTALTNNSRFTLASTNISQTPLPIELLNFTATTIDTRLVKLEWQTAAEINNDYFTVERSANGTQWTTIATISGSGNSSTVLSYTALDEHPYHGTSYYRLKQTDFDGQYSYSAAKSVKIEAPTGGVSTVSPNPAHNEIIVKGKPSELIQIRIFNIFGQDVTRQTGFRKNSYAEIAVDVSALNSGIYFVTTPTSIHKLYKQ